MKSGRVVAFADAIDQCIVKRSVGRNHAASPVLVLNEAPSALNVSIAVSNESRVLYLEMELEHCPIAAPGGLGAEVA